MIARWIIFCSILIMAVLCVGCGLWIGNKEGKIKAYVDNISFEDLSNNTAFIVFNLNSNSSQLQDCYVNISFSQGGKVFESEEAYLGLLGSLYYGTNISSNLTAPSVLSKKILGELRKGDTDVNIIPVCAPAKKEEINLTGYSAGLINLGLKGSCNNVSSQKEKFLCSLIKSYDIPNSYVEECFNGRELSYSFFCLAFFMGDYRICNNIGDLLFYRCLAFSNKDPSFCGMSGNVNYNDVCYAEMAASNTDKSLCSNIRDKKLNADCSRMLPQKEE